MLATFILFYLLKTLLDQYIMKLIHLYIFTVLLTLHLVFLLILSIYFHVQMIYLNQLEFFLDFYKLLKASHKCFHQIFLDLQILKMLSFQLNIFLTISIVTSTISASKPTYIFKCVFICMNHFLCISFAR